MANRHRGEVSFAAGGETYTLRYSANALAELEDALDKSVGEIVELMQSQKGLRIKTVRTIFRAGLLDRHPDITDQQAGDIISDVGLGEAANLLGRAFTAAFPPVEGGASESPQKGAAAGTGAGS